MTMLMASDELLKLANKVRLTRREIIDVLIGVEKRRRQDLVGEINARTTTAQQAAEELAALRMARTFLEVRKR